jgi:hypothetical protein
MPRKRILIAQPAAPAADPRPFSSPIGDEGDAARALGVSRAYVRKDRATAQRIPFFRVGRRVKYDIPAVIEAARSGRLGQ